MHTAINNFQNIIQGCIEIACFPYGQLPSVDVDKPHDMSPSNPRTTYIVTFML